MYGRDALRVTIGGRTGRFVVLCKRCSVRATLIPFRIHQEGLVYVIQDTHCDRNGNIGKQEKGAVLCQVGYHDDSAVQKIYGTRCDGLVPTR